MNERRFHEITSRYADLRVAVVGDVCLDRYLEIDPQLVEVSLETGLRVDNVVRVRALPGAAGTIVNNLCALGIGSIQVIGFVGDDGEGYELRRALASLANVRINHLITTSERRTFTYCKPLVLEEGNPPRELNRLDSKNWSPTPISVQERLAQAVLQVAPSVDAIILMDQVDLPETGVVTKMVREAVHATVMRKPGIVALADSRRSLIDYPPLAFKMNGSELLAFAKSGAALSVEEMKRFAASLAARNAQPVFVTLAEAGIVAASPGARTEHVESFPVRGPIDVVGAGDSVTANLAAALAAGATLREATLLSMAAASVVIHQLGTTGTASVDQLTELLCC